MDNMKKYSLMFVAVAFAATIGPVVTTGVIGAAGQGQRGAAPARNATPPTTPVTGSAAAGKQLYFGYTCYGCHGFNGETGRAFVGNWSSNLASEDNFIRFLRGRANVAPATPSTSMPNFAESTMSDKQAKDIYSYIRTFKSNAPELKDIPTLNAIIKSASRPYKP